MSENQQPAEKRKILAVGLDDRTLELVKPHCPGYEFVLIKTGQEFEGQFDSWVDGMFSAVFAGRALTEVPANELAQVLQNQCPETVKFFMTFDIGNNFEPKLLLKNGFNQVFALPIDTKLMAQAILEHITADGKKKRSYRSVKVLDLDEGASLDFSTYVYLPLNKKHVCFSAAKETMSKSKKEKLEQHQMSSIFVDHKDLKKFYAYTAEKMRNLGGDGVSSTERTEKLKDYVRGLFTDLFDSSVKADFNEGKEAVENTQNIISSYITKGGDSDWYKKLTSTISEAGDAYNHAANVSTFAALFAIGLGKKNPEDLAMAGLFHDLGMNAISQEIQDKNPKDLKPEEKAIYEMHPEKSLNYLKTKRIIVNDTVEKAILQHHENFMGKGFPKQLAGPRIIEEAQILSFADQFDYLTRIEPGKPRLTPLQAWESIHKTGTISPELMGRLKKLLKKDSDSAAA